MAKSWYKINLVFCIVTTMALLVPTLGALCELMLGFFQIYFLFAILKKRSVLDKMGRRMLRVYLGMILLYFLFAGTFVYYLLHNEVNLQNDFLDSLVVFFVFGPPLLFAWYFVFFLKYVTAHFQPDR